MNLETAISFDYDLKIQNDGPLVDRCIDIDLKESERKKINRFSCAQNREFYRMTALKESIWNINYQFICMGDTQLGMGDQKKEEEFSRLAVEFINERKDSIKFVVICGDLTHNLEDIWSKGDLKVGEGRGYRNLPHSKGYTVN